jgi:WD40 repeat protein
MRGPRLLLAAVLITPLAGLVSGPPLKGAAEDGGDKPRRSPAAVDKLIEQLGDDDADTRAEAAKKLEAVGEEALPAVRKAAKSHADADVRLRAAVVAAAIQKKLYGEVRKFEGHKGWVFRVALTPDGKRAVSAGDALRVWDLESGKCLRTFGEGLGGWGLSVSRDGKRALCAAFDRTVRLWELGTGKEVQRFTGHGNEVWVAVLAPDGKHALTGSFDRTIRVWDVGTGKEVRQFKDVPDLPRCAAWSPDGKHVAIGHYAGGDYMTSKGTVRVWEFATGKEVKHFEGHDGAVTALAYSKDGKRLASSSFDKTVRIWDVEKGKELKKITGHPGPVDGVSFTPDGKRVVSCGWDHDHTVRVWDVSSGKELARYDGHTEGPLCVVVTPDGKHVLSSGKDGTLRLWPLRKR